MIRKHDSLEKLLPTEHVITAFYIYEDDDDERRWSMEEDFVYTAGESMAGIKAFAAEYAREHLTNEEWDRMELGTASLGTVRF